MVLRERLKILLGVYMVRGPMGPLSWHYLEYAAGLARLGHDVTVVEDSDDHEWTCYNPLTGELGTDPSYGLAYATRALAPYGLGDRLAYFDVHGGGWTGPGAAGIARVLREADLYINVSGANVLRPDFERVPKRVFIDTDPGFVQLRNLKDPQKQAATARHNVFLSFGERFGSDDCLIPNDGFPWRPTRQPVLLDAWPASPPANDGAFTTVMRWDSYRPLATEELSLGMKSESFMQVLDLPQRTTQRLEIALGLPAPVDLLVTNGWRLCDPQVVAPDPPAFRDYVVGSAGEFTVAKHGYVVTRSGWFSERSAHYLASGRPVVTEETGFSDVLPTGEGLLAFSDGDSALAALDEVAGAPARHAKAARDVAESFDARVVLPKLIDDVFA